MIQQSKKELRKEIGNLIDNIKEHSDELTELRRIPQLEVEVIVSKIKKLYEKSVVFSYLNAMEDDLHYHDIREQRAASVMQVNKSVIAEINTEPAGQEAVAVIAASEPAAVVTEPVAPVINRKISVGLNDKFRLVSGLFKGNNALLEETLHKISTLPGEEEVNRYISELVQQHGWNMEDEHFLLLVEIIDRK